MPRTLSRGRTARDERDEDQEDLQGFHTPDEVDRPSRGSRRVSRGGSSRADRPPRDRDRDDDRSERRTRSSRGRDDGDDRSERRGRSSREEATSTTIGKGWSSVRKQREERSSADFAPRLKIDKEDVLIKFVDEEPFVTYYQHWISEFKGENRQMSFICLGDDCPLCEIGDKPTYQALFNVIDLTDPDEPRLVVWYATPNPAGAIEEREKDKKYSPISRDDLYFAVSKKKGKNGFFDYSVDPVKARDLEEDWDIEPLGEDEIADLAKDAYDEEIVRLNTRRDLAKIADELGD